MIAEIFSGNSIELSAARFVIIAKPFVPWFSVFHVPRSFGSYIISFIVKIGCSVLRGDHLFQQFAVERIALLGPVHPHGFDRAVLLDDDLAHGALLRSRFTGAARRGKGGLHV